MVFFTAEERRGDIFMNTLNMSLGLGRAASGALIFWSGVLRGHFHSMLFDWVISILMPINFSVTPLTSMGPHYVPLCLYGPQFGPLLASMCLCGHRYAPMGLFKPLWAIRDMLTWASMSPFGPLMLAISERNVPFVLVYLVC